MHQCRVDVHHHAIPDRYRRAMREAGVTDPVPGVDYPQWDLDTDMAVLDRQGITSAILSITTPGLTFLDVPDRPRIARAVNEDLAGIARDHRGRYGAFAVLPLPDVPRSIAEADYALDELGLDGIGIFTHVDGIYPGDSRLASLIAHLAERDAITFIHPVAPPGTGLPTFGLPPSLYEFAFDTTRMMASLLYSGTLERHPGWRFILSHAGGAVPYLATRRTYGSTIAGRLIDRQPDDPLALLRRPYYDTALSASRFALPSLTALADPGHIVLGTDYPFMPESVTAETIAGLSSFFAGAELAGIEHQNALGLFPRFGDPAPAPAGTGLG
jgi:predicted TIM-barrel fold metal-dependent hydrolase